MRDKISLTLIMTLVIGYVLIFNPFSKTINNKTNKLFEKRDYLSFLKNFHPMQPTPAISMALLSETIKNYGLQEFSPNIKSFEKNLVRIKFVNAPASIVMKWLFYIDTNFKTKIKKLKLVNQADGLVAVDITLELFRN